MCSYLNQQNKVKKKDFCLFLTQFFITRDNFACRKSGKKMFELTQLAADNETLLRILILFVLTLLVVNIEKLCNLI